MHLPSLLLPLLSLPLLVLSNPITSTGDLTTRHILPPVSAHPAGGAVLFRRGSDGYGEYDDGCFEKHRCSDMYEGNVVVGCVREASVGQEVDLRKAAACLCGNRSYTHIIKKCFACYEDAKHMREEYITECKAGGVTLSPDAISFAVGHGQQQQVWGVCAAAAAAVVAAVVA